MTKLDMFLPTGFTEDLDRYYNYLLGIGREASKPSLNISEPLKDFIMAVEGTGKAYRTNIVNTLLNFDGPGQEDTIEKLVELAERCRERREFDDFSVRNLRANAAMTFFFYPRRDAERLQNMRRHSRILKYHYKLDEYTLFTVDVRKQGWTGVDFETFKYKWSYGRNMEEIVKNLRMRRVDRERQSHGKIGRNDPCPCGSGKKYKKCCGSTVSY